MFPKFPELGQSSHDHGKSPSEPMPLQPTPQLAKATGAAGVEPRSPFPQSPLEINAIRRSTGDGGTDDATGGHAKADLQRSSALLPRKTSPSCGCQEGARRVGRAKMMQEGGVRRYSLRKAWMRKRLLALTTVDHRSNSKSLVRLLDARSSAQRDRTGGGDVPAEFKRHCFPDARGGEHRWNILRSNASAPSRNRRPFLAGQRHAVWSAATITGASASLFYD